MANTLVIAPSEQDRVEARKLLARLASLPRQAGTLEITIGGESLQFSQSVAGAIFGVLDQLAAGGSPVVVPSDHELSPQDAANILNVSRPYVTGLLDSGVLPYRKVGNHHRIPLSAVLAYKEKSYARSKQLLDELAEETQELGLGYQGRKKGQASS